MLYWGFIQIHNFLPRVPMWVNLINSCRTCLLCLLTLIQGGSYMVEQPGSSCMPHYKRFVWLSRVSKVAWHNYIRWTRKLNKYIYIYIYIYTILLGFSFHVCGKQIKEFSLTDWSPIQVFRIAWWMAHYSSPSPKRHLGLTNNVWADKLNKGKLTKEAREKLTLKPVYRTVSKSGKRGYKGNKLLKSTQSKP